MSTLIGSLRWLSQKVRYTGKRRLRGAVFFPGPQQYMWYVEVLEKPATKEIGLFTTPSLFKF